MLNSKLKLRFIEKLLDEYDNEVENNSTMMSVESIGNQEIEKADYEVIFIYNIRKKINKNTCFVFSCL